MIAGIKKCIDEGDITGLRYIFLDSLDVDPTFEKYKNDYSACKKIEGMFESYSEMTPFSMVSTDWNMDYWVKIKFDQKKNFSEKRFEHMIEIAKVVHADKIERLLAERAAKQAKIGEQIEQVIPKYTASNIMRTDVKKTTNENSSSASRINNQAIIAESGISELDQAKINENKKDLELHNPRIEQAELEKKRQREARAKEIERQNALVEAQNQPKKSYGDCSNNSNNCNSGSSTLVKGTVRQSLYKSSTAISEETKAKVLFSSAGYHTIFDSSECKFDYSAKKEYLRKTLYRRIGYASLEKIGEEIYRFISTDDERNIIKNAGGKWIPYPREGRIGNVIVYEHVNIQDYITGWYKTETKVKNPNGSYTNWIRYYRRVGGK